MSRISHVKNITFNAVFLTKIYAGQRTNENLMNVISFIAIKDAVLCPHS